MRERILLFIIITCLGVFLYIFQNHVNTVNGFLILCACMTVYGLYSIAATKYQKRKLKKHPMVVNENFQAMLADEKLSKALQVKKGSAIFKRVRTAYNEDNKPIEYTISYYRGERYSYSIELRNRK